MGAKWNLATHARSEPLRRRQHHWSTQRRRDAPTTHQGAQLMLAECFFSAFQLRRRPETRAARPHAPERRVSCYPCRMRLLRAFRARLPGCFHPLARGCPLCMHLRASALVVGLSVPESPGCSISARRVTTISWPTGPPRPPMPPPARRPQQPPRRRRRHARHPRPSPRRRWLASRHRLCRRPTTAATARRQRRRRRPS